MHRAGVVCALLLVGAAPVPQGRLKSVEVKDGLSLTVSLDNKVFAPADEIFVRFRLKNETDQDLYVGDGFLAPGYHEAGPGRHFEVHVTAETKSPLYFWSGTATEGRT